MAVRKFTLLCISLRIWHGLASHCKGGEYWAEKAEKCLHCAAGKFAPEGSDKCKVCPPGTFSKTRSTECTKCASDEYSHAESASCSKCPHGADTGHGGQCGVGLCGHTCKEVVQVMKTKLDCTWTWDDGCGHVDAPAPFTSSSTLFEMCPHECEAHPDQEHAEERPPDPRFKPLAGGDHEHQACRHKDEDDDDKSYYVLEEADHMTLKMCEEKCVKHDGCTGIEYKSYFWDNARCEVWIKPILATSKKTSYGADAHGFFCLLYDASATAEISDRIIDDSPKHDNSNTDEDHDSHESKGFMQPKTAAIGLGAVAVVATAGGLFMLSKKQTNGPAE